ncbi:hypothetical protein [Kocuria nitroreducens]|uniref:hypothetical protein n=1 Tax=Kocuria nitroreducens TaxID=3058914 RepID=UPI0036DDF1B7
MSTAPGRGRPLSPDGPSAVLADLGTTAGIGTAVAADEPGRCLATLSPDDQ